MLPGGSIYGGNYRLPTDQEWQKAAGWDPSILRKLWLPFQTRIDCNWCNYNGCYSGPFPVGSFNGTGGKTDAKSYYGCYDMTGNVWEWTFFVMEGGGFDSACSLCWNASSTKLKSEQNQGFRLVLVAE